MRKLLRGDRLPRALYFAAAIAYTVLAVGFALGHKPVPAYIYTAGAVRPGENQARCMANSVRLYSYYTVGTVTKINPDDHSMDVCKHGFYAYYDGSNDYYEPGKVMGVIEGYGETVIGSRGFRCMKARIIALHIPDEVGVGRRRQIMRAYPDIPTFDSFDAMVAEFPPDDNGQGISPDTDPDFWTRP